MADDEHGDPLALGQLHQGHGAVLHLSHPSGGGIQVLVIQGLDGVHDQHIRLLAADALQDIAQAGLRQNVQIIALRVQALGP